MHLQTLCDRLGAGFFDDLRRGLGGGAGSLSPRLLPGPDYVDRAAAEGRRVCGEARGPAWMRSFQALFDAGRPGGSGYVVLFDAVAPGEAGGADVGGAGREAGGAEAIAALAQEGGCSGLVASEAVIAAVARRYAHRVPLIARVAPAPDVAAQARRLRDHGVVGIAVGDAARAGELAAAATDEGLIVIAHGAPAHGAALDCAGFEPIDDDAARALTEARRRVVASQAVASGHLVAGDLRDPVGLQRAGVVGLRAGALGLVVRGVPRPSVEADVAVLHAAQDVWECGEIGLV